MKSKLFRQGNVNMEFDYAFTSVDHLVIFTLSPNIIIVAL